MNRVFAVKTLASVAALTLLAMTIAVTRRTLD
jgi:hypothetical protein